ncbi:Glucans biosynthesis protein G precursor [Pseudobythopirellula maris]|uniref:Glucans biosynthesis protein G n=1 Tax=Pseudobythopirellula maris TaxID=2527991 RepID=A0A5C5ZKB7_9BACT|nr:glucan biosynthesis protein [Pseudobythopirellula maris]TWT87646.1 Glucans biosynthesis protein G precursor [Pseudobythopirellula maris]
MSPPTLSRLAVVACLAAAPVSALAAPEPAEVRSFEDVVAMASEQAAVQHQPPTRAPQELLDLDYDGYRKIAVRHENAMWRDEDRKTWAEFYPAGSIFEYPVDVYVVDEDKTRRVEYGPQWFQFRGETERLADSEGGLAGMRLLTRLPGNEHKTEFVSFLGASYYRAIGTGQWYGTSARGLAVDIGLGTPEEFPRFTKYWIQPPTSDSEDPEVVWALMDSPAVSGAYEFRVSPGEATEVFVTAHVWMRHGVQKLAVAPLTSMFMWDADHQPEGDHRPEVHDADALVIHGATPEGETWVWRDLERPDRPKVSSWPLENLYGFGLVQSERDPAKYNDNEAHYHERPNVWVDVGARWPWGPGRVELLELDAKHEGMDNIGAYYVFDTDRVDFKEAFTLNYRVVFSKQAPEDTATERVAQVEPESYLGKLRVNRRIAAGMPGSSSSAP